MVWNAAIDLLAPAPQPRRPPRRVAANAAGLLPATATAVGVGSSRSCGTAIGFLSQRPLLQA
jgi:hypothetical protein